MMDNSQPTAVQFIERHLELEAQGISIDWKATAIKIAQAVTPAEPEPETEGPSSVICGGT